ncbi:heavy metal tolerance protein precursor [Apiospora marii]|uniref:heavy metal tolerance protein precursor n=1 Tax=Apiospora marii TaxID=335849 RepID=UPI00312F3D3F
MHDPPKAEIALHYVAPIAIGLYLLIAKTIASCFLQKGTARSASGQRWRITILLSIATHSTVAAELISTIYQAVTEPSASSSPPQDYVVYLILLSLVLLSLTVGLTEDAKPIWRIYLGAWVLALGLEAPLLALRLLTTTEARGFYATIRIVSEVLRVGLLLALTVAGAWFMWSDGRRRIMLSDDDNDEAETLIPSDSDMDSDSDGSEGGEAYGFPEDSDGEDPEEHRRLRKQQLGRLKAAGSWFNYLKAYKIFWPLLWPRGDRGIQVCLAVAALAVMAERALNLLVPRQLGIIGEELAAGAGDGQMPWKSIGLWVLFAALRSEAGLPMIKELLQVPVRQATRQNIMTTSFSHVMHLSMDFHNEKSSGELIRAIEQASELQEMLEFVCFTVAPVFVDLAVALVYVYFLFDVYMSLVVLCMGLAYVWIGGRVNSLNTRLLRDYNTTLVRESKIQNEAINSWPTVAQFNRAPFECGRYAQAALAHRVAAVRYYLAWTVGGGVQSVVMTAGHLAATVLAAWRVAHGLAPVGSFITLAAYWMTIEEPMFEVTYSVRKITQMLTNSERLLQLLSTKPSIVDAPDAAELVLKRGEVVFDGVDFAYDARKPTLRGVSFTARPGQTVALVGETGGGKSTILKLLYRYFDVGAGAVRIDGQDIRTVTLDSLRAQFAVVPQDPALFNLSIRENLRYARLDATDAEVEAACRAAAVHDAVAALPAGYATTVGERGVKLSGGERQRLAIARAILRDAPIVLLDEATSMVDAATEAAIQTALRALSRGRTTFVVAHRLSTVREADCILVIQDGRVAETGTHAQLLEAGGTYARLCAKQAGTPDDDLMSFEGGNEDGAG